MNAREKQAVKDILLDNARKLLAQFVERTNPTTISPDIWADAVNTLKKLDAIDHQ